MTDQAFQLAGDLGNNVWKWHIRYGYVLSGLFVFRIVIEFFQPGKQKFIYRIKNAIPFTKIKTKRKPAFHYLFTRMIYLFFYTLLGTITGTGIWLSFHRPPVNVEQFHAVKEIHESSFLFFLLFIFFHIGGVILAERKHHRNLVSGMIHGGGDLQDTDNENSIKRNTVMSNKMGNTK